MWGLPWNCSLGRSESFATPCTDLLLFLSMFLFCNDLLLLPSIFLSALICYYFYPYFYLHWFATSVFLSVGDWICYAPLPHCTLTYTRPNPILTLRFYRLFCMFVNYFAQKLFFVVLSILSLLIPASLSIKEFCNNFASSDAESRCRVPMLSVVQFSALPLDQKCV